MEKAERHDRIVAAAPALAQRLAIREPLNDVAIAVFAAIDGHGELVTRVNANGMQLRGREGVEQVFLESHVAARNVKDADGTLVVFVEQLSENALPSRPRSLARTVERFAVFAVKRCVQKIENVDGFPIHASIVAIGRCILLFAQ